MVSRVLMAVLERLAAVDKEAAGGGAGGDAGDEAGAAAEGTAEVVPPGLAEVVAVGEGGAYDDAGPGVDPLEGGGVVGTGFAVELVVEIGEE
jgi:hypothetical protein